MVIAPDQRGALGASEEPREAMMDLSKVELRADVIALKSVVPIVAGSVLGAYGWTPEIARRAGAELAASAREAPSPELTPEQEAIMQSMTAVALTAIWESVAVALETQARTYRRNGQS